MTLQELLEKNYNKTIIDEGGIEWTGFSLIEEFMNAGDEGINDLGAEIDYFRNGQITILRESTHGFYDREFVKLGYAIEF